MALVLEAVEQLDAELLRILHSVRAIAPSAMDATNDLSNVRASLRRAFKVTRGIREHILDGELDPTSSSVRASALRARGIVVALQVSELEMASRSVTMSMTPDARLYDLDAFRSRVLAHVGRLNAKWIQQARELRAEDHDGLATILATAESEFVALGADEDVRRFLTWGALCAYPPFARACRTLGVLLGMRDEQNCTEVPSLPPIRRACGRKN